MKTPEEILTKVLNEWDNPNDLDLMSILAKRSLPFMKKAMEEYGSQSPTDEQCDEITEKAGELFGEYINDDICMDMREIIRSVLGKGCKPITNEKQ